MKARHDGERGYALLFVFLLAAFVAITLYTEMPRVAFERQRELEQDLIDRGEQYRRAIQLYFRQFRRYPPNLEALENTNNIRFLRRRYKDPMTGETEWRLIHVGPGGVLTDSLVRKNLQTEKLASSNQFITELQSIGAAVPGQSGTPQPLAAIAVRRAAEAASGTGGMPPGGIGSASPEGASGETPEPEQAPPPPPGAPEQVASSETAGPVPFVPPQPGQQAPTPPVPFIPLQPGQAVPGQPAVAIQPGAGPSPGPFPQPGAYPAGPGAVQPPVPVPGLPPPFTQPVAAGEPGSSQPVVPAQPIRPFGQPVSAPVAGVPVPPGQNPAAEILRRILTSPNPRGVAVLQLQTQQQGGLSLQPGVAGVATKAEAEGIKVYNERTRYNEWEFIYDFSQDAAILRQLAAGGPGQPGRPGQPGAPGAPPATGAPAGPGRQPLTLEPQPPPPGFGFPPGPAPPTRPGRR